MVTASALVMVIATPSQNVQQRYHLTQGSLLSPVSSRNLRPSLFTLSMCSYLRPAFAPRFIHCRREAVASTCFCRRCVAFPAGRSEPQPAKQKTCSRSTPFFVFGKVETPPPKP